jgi:hypothetical protein
MKVKTMKSTVLAALMVTLTTSLADATPISFVDIGNIGREGTFMFDTIGSLHTAEGISTPIGQAVDTELGLWDAYGNLLDTDDDGFGSAFASEITADLSAGIYFLGISEFNSIFRDGFVNAGSGFEQGEVADRVLNINGTLGSLFEGASDAFDKETAILRVEVSAVPVPAGLPLLASGFAFFAFMRKRRGAAEA